MKWQPLILAALLAVPSAIAQGNFLYTWHGNSGYFQASFQVPPEENQPGQYFEGGLFESTFSITSPNTTYPVSGGSFTGADASGYGPPLILHVRMTDPVGQTEIAAVGYSGSYVIREYPIANPGSVLWLESGYWGVAQVPEPTVPALLSLGASALLWRSFSGKV
jgi:hypothetical protein